MKKNLKTFKSSFSINNRMIGDQFAPFLIAELSGNHKGSLERALTLIEKAAATGVDAVKIQTYRPDTITLNNDGPDFCLTKGLWKGRTLYDLYQEAHTPWEWHAELFAKAKSLGVTLFSSPFDCSAIDLLENLACPAYKIASFEITDIKLLNYAASTGKPIIMSTGMATKEEIDEAVQAISDGGGHQLAILHCVSGYPTPVSDCNLRTISNLKQSYQLPIGLSDHTIEHTTSITAVALGATIIEKHFTLFEDDDSVDAKFSLSPEQFTQLVKETNKAWQALGQVNYHLKSSEIDNKNFRRSLYISKNIKAGEAFTENNIQSVRPGFGLHPRYLSQILKSRASTNLTAGTALAFEHLIKDIRP